MVNRCFLEDVMVVYDDVGETTISDGLVGGGGVLGRVRGNPPWLNGVTGVGGRMCI